MKKIQLSLLIFIIVIFLFEDFLLASNHLRWDRAILGLQLEHIDVSNQTKPQIAALIALSFNKTRPLRLTYQNKIFTVVKSEIDAKIDYQQTLDQLLGVGRGGNVVQNIVTQNMTLFGFTNKKIVHSLSPPLLTVKVLDIADQINTEPKPPMPDFTGNWQTILPKRDGVKVPLEKLALLIQNNIFSPPDEPIEIPTTTITKSYDTSNLNNLRQQAAEYIASPISIRGGGLMFTLAPQDLKPLLTIKEQPDPVYPKKTILALGLDSSKLNQKLGPFGKQVESITNAEFNEDYARVAIYSQFYTNTRRIVDVPTGAATRTQVLGARTTNGKKTIYITFDDGPNIVYHPLLLDILKAKGVKATFYFVGTNSQLYKSTTQRTIREGHVIGDHTLSHSYLPKLQPSQILDEIKTTEIILNSFLGGNKKITLFRPPYGGTNSYVVKDAKDLGLKTYFWSIDPRDWSDPPTQELVDRVLKNPKDGDILLLHSNHFATVKALPTIIDKLREKGFDFRLQE